MINGELLKHMGISPYPGEKDGTSWKHKVKALVDSFPSTALAGERYLLNNPTVTVYSPVIDPTSIYTGNLYDCVPLTGEWKDALLLGDGVIYAGTPSNFQSFELVYESPGIKFFTGMEAENGKVILGTSEGVYLMTLTEDENGEMQIAMQKISPNYESEDVYEDDEIIEPGYDYPDGEFRRDFFYDEANQIILIPSRMFDREEFEVYDPAPLMVKAPWTTAERMPYSGIVSGFVKVGDEIICGSVNGLRKLTYADGAYSFSAITYEGTRPNGSDHRRLCKDIFLFNGQAVAVTEETLLYYDATANKQIETSPDASVNEHNNIASPDYNGYGIIDRDGKIYAYNLTESIYLRDGTLRDVALRANSNSDGVYGILAGETTDDPDCVFRWNGDKAEGTIELISELEGFNDLFYATDFNAGGYFILASGADQGAKAIGYRTVTKESGYYIAWLNENQQVEMSKLEDGDDVRIVNGAHYVHKNGALSEISEDGGSGTAIDAYTKAEVDTALAAKANTSDVYNKDDVDDILSRKLDTSGGELSGSLTVPEVRGGGDGTPYLNLVSQDISEASIWLNGEPDEAEIVIKGNVILQNCNGLTGVPTPTANNGAANKQYVDNSVSGLAKTIEVTDEATALTQSAANPNNIYFIAEESA